MIYELPQGCKSLFVFWEWKNKKEYWFFAYASRNSKRPYNSKIYQFQLPTHDFLPVWKCYFYAKGLVFHNVSQKFENWLKLLSHLFVLSKVFDPFVKFCGPWSRVHCRFYLQLGLISTFFWSHFWMHAIASIFFVSPSDLCWCLIEFYSKPF